MGRWARFFRALGGLFLLVNLAAFFLPVLSICQENYPTIQYSQFQYVWKLTERNYSNEQLAVVIAFIVLPVFLALVMGIIGIVGNYRQVISGIGSLVVLGLNIGFYFNSKLLEPERLNDAQRFEKAYGLWVLLGVSAAAAVCGIVGLILTPGKSKAVQSNYGETAKQGGQPESSPQIEQEFSPQTSPAGNPSLQPRGVMVGLKGDYEGAEIPFQPGETLKLGRDLSNDLIFANASRVSRFHCALTWIPEKKKYQILDQSANGCFVDGREECIPQNIAIYLDPGTVLDIGNEENRFRLE